MRAAMRIARRIDRASRATGRIAAWIVLAACLVTIFNALARYGFHFAQALLLDLPSFLFAAIVLGGASRTLAEGSHIRVDILYRSLGTRARAVIDIIGNLMFLIPFCLVMIVMGWPAFLSSWRLGEGALTPGGLPQWPVKALIPFSFALLLAQALSELVKSVPAACGLDGMPPAVGRSDRDTLVHKLSSGGAP
jgi:TRAP-type mannitol/chloroaromatic compound transport system permease small subunit